MRKTISVLLVIAMVITMAAAYITVGADGTADTLTLSTAKTAFALDEDIVVDITGYTETLSSHDLELRMEKVIMPKWKGFTDRVGYMAYFDIGTNARDEYANPIPTPTSTHQVTFKNGIRVHPTDSSRGNLTMTAGFYTLWVLDFTAQKECANRIYIAVGENLPSLTLSKDTYNIGEDIIATYANFTSEYYGHDYAEVDIFKDGDIPGKQGSKAGNVVWHKDSTKTQSGLSSATISFPDDDTDRNGVNFPLPAGDYYMMLRADNNMVGIPVYFTIVEPYPTISTNKTEYVRGESIEITYANFTRSYWGSSYSEIDLLRKGDVVGVNSCLAYYNISSGTTQLNETSGTISFPEDDVRQGQYFPLAAGEYYVCLRANATIVGEIVEFTVVDPEPPTVSVSKDVYLYGEDIVATYANFTSDYWGTAFSEIDIFKKGDVVGSNPSKASYMIYDSNASNPQTGLSAGTITFPDDDNGRNGVNFPLAPGEYYVCVRSDNTVIGDVAEFTVLPGINTASVTLTDSIGVNFKVDAAGVDTEKYAMTLEVSFLGEDYTLAPVLKDSKYVFSFNDITPDQMTDDIEATLVLNYLDPETHVEADSITFSIANYCYTQLANLPEGSDKLETLLVDLLVYGEKAQLYTEHNTDKLATADLTEAQRAKGTQTDPALTNNKSNEALEGATAVWTAAGLNLEDSISIRVRFTAESAEGLSVKVANGTEIVATITADEFEAAGTNSYYAFFKLPNPTFLYTDYTFTVMSGSQAVSGALTYSAESYAASVLAGSSDDALCDLVNALMIYGASVTAYVNAQ